MVNTKIGYKKSTKGIEFVSLSDIPMLDWDWPNEGHRTAECITITNLKEVLVILEAYLELHPSQSIRVYVTPGGVRAFFLGESISVKEFFENKGGETLKADPLYVRLAKRLSSFPVRISPKPIRKGDFVASYCCTLGQEPNKHLLDVLLKVHDQPIRQKRHRSANVTYNW